MRYVFPKNYETLRLRPWKYMTGYILIYYASKMTQQDDWALSLYFIQSYRIQASL
jgi:hypothetical protein